MEPPRSDDLDERLESLPWEHVGPVEGPDRRWMMALAGAVLLVAVVAAATRTLWPGPPLAATVSPPVTVEQALPSMPAASSSVVDAPSSTEGSPVTEADLRAVSPDDAERAVTGHAEWFVSEWLTIDGTRSETTSDLLPAGVDVPVVDVSARSFVESAVGLTAEEIEPGAWEVAVLVRSLSAFGDGDYSRIPARVFLVTVGIGDDGPFVADLPSPGPVPAGRAPSVEYIEAPAPLPVTDAALEIMREAGLPDENSIETFRLGDRWRVTGIVRDLAGVPFVVSVWLDGSGERVPAPG